MLDAFLPLQKPVRLNLKNGIENNEMKPLWQLEKKYHPTTNKHHGRQETLFLNNDYTKECLI